MNELEDTVVFINKGQDFIDGFIDGYLKGAQDTIGWDKTDVIPPLLLQIRDYIERKENGKL